jgi:hypothetical protein
MDMGLFEHLSALWDCVGGDHRQCAQREDTAAQEQYHAFEFQCPVAAAFLRAGLAMSLEAEPRGAWPSFRRYYGGWRPERSVPAWAAPLVAQEQLRLYVLDALQHLASLASRGWHEAIWEPDSAGKVQVTTTSKGLFIAGTASDEDLLTACREAAGNCRAGLQQA